MKALLRTIRRWFRRPLDGDLLLEGARVGGSGEPQVLMVDRKLSAEEADALRDAWMRSHTRPGRGGM